MPDCHSALPDIDLHDVESRCRLAKMIMRLFDHWRLPVRDQAVLLGLSPKSGTTIARYRAGRPFADRQDLLGRAGHLLGIHQALRSIFPHNIELAYRWVSQPNKQFGNTAPIEIMKQGYEGLLRIRRHLELEAP
ncbi:antitoxin Xre/MbcA/ParS toxin-binding domain-containing protein [Geothermobacter hydrogeniphilus]|uniref:Antitoxin Xre/MbcA/ParS-like toxin-binding domain-containing protein n=1 Tax=Geothermobacter hydrogeniphilus TaxID=1969733 RepID=A0A1X0Y5E1_9BACT|nr:antitoxin Xre/MbcA/ParS toxin-binding domain-containing protein [Geothermobacter hydrogeniphilus]ORJ60292.1 hypothetical protein B5V00_08555 [Geothermobacter hydrogeniphilus]